MRKKCHVLIVLFCAAVALEAGEFPVNIRTASNQCNPSVAVYTDGSTIVVWSSYYSSSGRSNDIIARRFDAEGQPTTDEFQVNVNREGNQTYPSVATDAEGNALILWQGPGADGDEDIFARTFDVNGIALTDEMLLNTDLAGQQLNPSVASNGTGTFAVVWESLQDKPDGRRTSIRGQLLDPLGAPLGPELSIDPNNWECRYPDVAMDKAGRFVVTWMRDRSSNTIVARLLDPHGLAITDAFEVSIASISSITRPSVATSPAGDFAIAWDGDPNSTDRDKIHIRLFDPNAEPKADPFVVSSASQGPQQWPQLAASDLGQFVVAWQAESDAPSTATDILARRFDRSGEPLGEPFQLNDWAPDKQRYPAVAMKADGSFIAAWESDEQPGSDYDIYARVEPPLPMGDLNADGVVDFLDFQILAWSWREPSEFEAEDPPYGPLDLKTLCDRWLR